MIGLRIKNPSGGLVLASESSYGLNYIGKATLQSLTQASGDATTDTGRTAGFGVYRIVSVNRPVVFIGLTLDRVVTTAGVVNVGGNNWDVTVYCGGAPLDSDGFQTQYEADVYCFAVPTAHSGVGLRINDDAGNLRWSVTDTAGRLLYLKGAFDVSAVSGDLNANVATLPTLSAPAVLGFPCSTKENSTPVGPFFDCRFFRFGWERTSATAVSQTEYRTVQFRNDGGNSNLTVPNVSQAMVIDATGLT